MKSLLVFHPAVNSIKIYEKQAEAELGQAQHNQILVFAEAEVGTELGNKNPHKVDMRSTHLAD